jgi:hypothetical protein
MTDGSRGLLRIGPVELSSTAFAMMRARPVAAAVLAALYSALLIGGDMAATRLGVTEAATLTRAMTAYHATVAVGSAALSAATLRALLGEGRARWRVDSGLLASLAVMTPAGLAISLMPLALNRFAGPADVLTTLFLILVILGLTIFLYAKLALWPAGLAMGDFAITPVRSWSLMRGATLGYVVAQGVLLAMAAAPLFLAGAGPLAQIEGVASVLSGLANGVASVVLTALTAALYRLRRVGNEADLAAVFA